MACTITATKLGVKVAHLEAGLRSGDRTMPEELNRLVTDAPKGMEIKRVARNGEPESLDGGAAWASGRHSVHNGDYEIVRRAEAALD